MLGESKILSSQLFNLFSEIRKWEIITLGVKRRGGCLSFSYGSRFLVFPPLGGLHPSMRSPLP